MVALQNPSYKTVVGEDADVRFLKHLRWRRRYESTQLLFTAILIQMLKWFEFKIKDTFHNALFQIGLDN